MGRTRPARRVTAAPIDTWMARPDEIVDERLLELYRAILDAGEQARMEGFRFARDRHSYLVAHALVRWALSACEERDPASWRFVANEHGRPEVAPEFGSKLRFNLSHTRGLVACAVAVDRSVGVDVESLRRPDEMDEVAGYAFAEEELRALAALTGVPRQRRFLEIWTLKEAYIKARGRGMDLPLDAIAIDVSPGERITATFGTAVADDPARWQFEQRWVSDQESLAVAITRTGADLGVVIRDVVPFA